MKQQDVLRVFIVAGCLLIVASGLFAETYTLQAAIPSPFGSFDRLRLVPRDSLPYKQHCDDVGDIGLMYFDNGLDERQSGMYICQQIFDESFHWVLIGREFVHDEKNVKYQHVVCVRPDQTFGKCINNPGHDGKCGCY